MKMSDDVDVDVDEIPLSKILVPLDGSEWSFRAASCDKNRQDGQRTDSLCACSCEPPYHRICQRPCRCPHTPGT